MSQITKAELDQAVEGQTIVDRFLETVRAHPQQVALRAKQADGSYAEWTYARVRRARGRPPPPTSGRSAWARGDRVVLMMRNIPEFHFVDLGVAALGATSISIYNSSSPEQVGYLTGHCKAKLALVEDDGFEERFLKVREELPALETIVNLSRDGVREELFDGGSVDLADEARSCTPDTLATVIYTSGTTGPPKGVMLSHYNIVWTAEGYLRMLDVEPVGFRAVSYLPMAHIAERMTTHYLAAMGGYEVTTCPDPGQIAAYAPRRAAPDHVRRAAGVGEDLRRRAGRAGRRPRQEGAVRRRRRGGHPHRRAPHVRRGHRGGRGDLPVPRRGRLRRRAGARRPRRRRVRRHRRGTDPARADQLVPRHRRAAVGDLRHVREHRPDDVGADAGEGGHRRHRVPRHRLLPRRRRRGLHPGRQRVPRVPRRSRRRRPRRSTPTARCTRATSGSSTTTATCASSTARRS